MTNVEASDPSAGGTSAPRPGAVLWQTGFRPFYLLAGLFGACSVLLWIAQHAGWIGRAWLPGALWHAHEMLFGYTLAVMVGFLITAGANWTGRPMPTGRLLMALALLWLTGRVLVLTPYGWAAAVVCTAFPLAAAIALAIPFLAAHNRRNYFFVALLCVMAAATAAIHLSQLQVIAPPAWLGIRIGLDVVLFIMAVMAGRVIPMFTNNGVPGAGAKRVDQIEKMALGSLLALLAADLMHLQGEPMAVVATVACGMHFMRLWLWHPWKTARVPLVWVLHLAYLWIPIHLGLRAAAEFGAAPANIATHALTIGAIGMLTLGMMTRTARGHTGRPLTADGWETACYLLVMAAAIVRVAGPWIAPTHYVGTVWISGLLWSAAFALFSIRYWPVLTRARVDGKPG